MPTKPKTSSILGTVHETARDLLAAGLITKRHMHEYDVLCLPPVVEYSHEEIRQLREHYHLSQGVFADILNTSVSTVRQWECGNKRPSGPSMKLLNILARKGLEVLK